jgi:hypothetical protein
MISIRLASNKGLAYSRAAPWILSASNCQTKKRKSSKTSTNLFIRRDYLH